MTAPSLAVGGQLMRRTFLVTLRVPAAIIPTVIFPLFFLVAFTGVYVSITKVPGFPTDNIYEWYVPFMICQGAAFAGMGSGFAVGRDIENGFMDRLLLSPQPRIVLMAGTVSGYVVRALATALLVLLFGISLGSGVPSVTGTLLLVAAVSGLSAIASCWAMGLMYRAKNIRVAPIFQLVIFISIFLSNAQVPVSVSTGWLHSAARVNPLTNIIRMSRQGFLDGGVTWGNTWPGLLAIVGGVIVVGAWAYRGLLRYTP